MLDFIVLVLATWRLASLLALEDGPLAIFARFRRHVGVHYDEYSNPSGTTELARGILCVWCNSMWIGLFWTGLYFVFRDAVLWLALPFALSAGAVIVERIAGGEGAN